MQSTLLKGKTALVTGSTSGIGLGIARTLAEQGANIVFNGFGDPAAIETLQTDLSRRCGVQTACHNADMSNPAEIEAMMRFAAERFGAVDIMPASSMSRLSRISLPTNGMPFSRSIQGNPLRRCDLGRQPVVNFNGL